MRLNVLANFDSRTLTKSERRKKRVAGIRSRVAFSNVKAILVITLLSRTAQRI